MIPSVPWRARAGWRCDPLAVAVFLESKGRQIVMSEYTNSQNLRKILLDPEYMVRAATPGPERLKRTFLGIDPVLWPGATCLWKLGKGDVSDHRRDQNELEPVACV